MMLILWYNKGDMNEKLRRCIFLEPTHRLKKCGHSLKIFVIILAMIPWPLCSLTGGGDGSDNKPKPTHSLEDIEGIFKGTTGP